MSINLRKSFLTLLMVLAPLWGQDLKQKAEKMIIQQFEKPVVLQFEKLPVTLEMRKEALHQVNQNYYFKYLYYWKIFQKDSLVGHAFVDNVFGKQMPITFLLMFDAEQKVVFNEVLKYREIKGRAVKKRDWLNLYIGKNADSGFGYGTDIDALSGSTISAKSMNRGIQKLCFLVEKVHSSYVASLNENPKAIETIQ